MGFFLLLTRIENKDERYVEIKPIPGIPHLVSVIHLHHTCKTSKDSIRLF